MIVRREPYTPDEIEIVDSRIRATCHPSQELFVFDECSYISLLTGRGGGKTTAAMFRLLRRAVRTPGANCFFFTATKDAAQRLVWTELKLALTKLRLQHESYESTLTIVLRNGSRVMLFGCDTLANIATARGFTYHEVVVDETATIRLEILNELIQGVIGPRLIGSLVLQGTPGSQLEGRFYEATRPGGKHWPRREQLAGEPEPEGWNGFSSHAWTVKDGADHGITAMQEFLRVALRNKKNEGWSDTNPQWLREYGGQWIQNDSTSVYVFRPYDANGQPFNQWDPPRDSFGFAVLPEHLDDWAYAIGIDIGWKDATAIEVFAFSYNDPTRTLYHVYEVYRGRIYANVLAKILIGDNLDHNHYGGIFGHIGWPTVLVGDFARSGGALLKELGEVYGIPVVAADKPYAYKNNSIELTNSMLYEGRVKLLKGSGIATEMTALQWVTDQHGKRTEAKNQNNHGSDAFIYLRDAVSPLLPHASLEVAPAIRDSSGTVAMHARVRALESEVDRADRDAESRRWKSEEPNRDANAMYDDGWL